MRVFVAVLIAALLGLQWPLWFGKASIGATQKMASELTDQKSRNATLLARNNALENEVKDLKNGLHSVEEYARAELGMVKAGDVFFQMVSQAPAPIVPKDATKKTTK